MGASDNVTVVRRWANEGFAQGKVELVDELLAADSVNHSPVPGQGPDRDGVKAGVLALHAAFPDLSLSEDDVIAQGEKVVLRDTIRGTHRGPFAGIPPTGKQVRISPIAIFRVVDGRIKEHWNLIDMLSVLQQLGAIPPPAGASR